MDQETYRKLLDVVDEIYEKDNPVDDHQLHRLFKERTGCMINVFRSELTDNPIIQIFEPSADESHIHYPTIDNGLTAYIYTSDEPTLYFLEVV